MSSRKQTISKPLELAVAVWILFVALSVLFDTLFAHEITFNEIIRTSFMGVVAASVIFVMEYRRSKRERQMQESIAQNSEREP